MSRKKIVWEAEDRLRIADPRETLVRREYQVKRIQSILKDKGIEYAMIDRFPGSEKYREAWTLNADKTAVVVDEKKAIKIAKTRAKAALIRERNEATAKGRYESMKSKTPFTGLEGEQKARFKDSLDKIEKCDNIAIIEQMIVGSTIKGEKK